MVSTILLNRLILVSFLSFNGLSGPYTLDLCGIKPITPIYCNSSYLRRLGVYHTPNGLFRYSKPSSGFFDVYQTLLLFHYHNSPISFDCRDMAPGAATKPRA